MLWLSSYLRQGRQWTRHGSGSPAKSVACRAISQCSAEATSAEESVGSVLESLEVEVEAGLAGGGHSRSTSGGSGRHGGKARPVMGWRGAVCGGGGGGGRE